MLQKTENMSPGSDVEFTPSSEPTPANINLDLTAKKSNGEYVPEMKVTRTANPRNALSIFINPLVYPFGMKQKYE
jgi:hypothetical protein